MVDFVRKYVGNAIEKGKGKILPGKYLKRKCAVDFYRPVSGVEEESLSKRVSTSK